MSNLAFNLSTRLRWAALLLFFPAAVIVLAVTGTMAATIQIVALGASNTRGYGVRSESTYPAQLQAMLRNKGYDVSVANKGIDYQRTALILKSLDLQVPPGTQIVILDNAPGWDRVPATKRHAHQAYIDAIVNKLRARNITTVVIGNIRDGGGRRLQADGIHLTAEGHAVLAAKLLPQVIAAILETKKSDQ